MKSPRTLCRRAVERALVVGGCLAVLCATPGRSAEPVVEPTTSQLEFRISAIVGNGTNVAIGVINRATKVSHMLRPGGLTPEGLRLVTVDFDRKEATFVREDRAYVARLEADASLIAVGGVAPNRNTLTFGPYQSSPPRGLPNVPAYNREAPFSNVVLRTDDGQTELAISAVKNDLDFVLLQSAGKSYAMSRREVEGLLSAPMIPDEDKIKALLSFPLLAEVQPGEEPRQAAERQAKNQPELPPPPTTTPGDETPPEGIPSPPPTTSVPPAPSP